MIIDDLQSEGRVESVKHAIDAETLVVTQHSGYEYVFTETECRYIDEGKLTPSVVSGNTVHYDYHLHLDEQESRRRGFVLNG